MPFDRSGLLEDVTLRGHAWCSAYSDMVDQWLRTLFLEASDAVGRGVALVAIGGYGRAELAPGSDVDLMLLHSGRGEIDALANRIWYPIWDAGLHLGHSVQTPKQALELAADDLDTATALLSARTVAGDAQLVADLGDAARTQWVKRAKRWLQALGEGVDARHNTAGEVAFRLEPDLKDGRGGLRDVHALRWAEAAVPVIVDYDNAALDVAYDVLLDARVELQRLTGRNSNVLALQDQRGVARNLGIESSDALMKGIAEAARTIAWTSDDTWRRIRATQRGRWTRRRGDEVAAGINLLNDELHVDPRVAQADPLLSLRVAVAAARHDVAIERESLELLATTPTLPDSWSHDARELFVELFLAGPPMIQVVEALDQRGVWTRILPEWLPVRAKPQHNAYHRFTVDRHLLEATANAALLVERVSRPDLLVVGALFHDLGKGHPGDHTEVGMRLVHALATRLGFTAHDRDVLVAMVEHHLLLPDAATRRDLDDPSTIERVAEQVGSIELLELLAALTEADSIATGPSAWSPWKAQLLATLVDRVAHVLRGGEASAATAPFPSEEQLARLVEPGQRIVAQGDLLTIMADDRPGLFSRVTGVLAMHGLDVLTAGVFSDATGRALEEFRVSDRYRDETPWDRVIADIELALEGRLAIHARVAERAKTYGKPTPYATPPRDNTVTIDNSVSADATVIDVETVDRIGVLYAITRALAEMDLDVQSAKVQTLGLRVVDAFYVRDRFGNKLDDPQVCQEIERAILHNLTV